MAMKFQKNFLIQFLPLHQASEKASLFEQSVIGPLFDDFALVQHKDTVAVFDGGQAVSDHNAGAAQAVRWCH